MKTKIILLLLISCLVVANTVFSANEFRAKKRCNPSSEEYIDCIKDTHEKRLEKDIERSKQAIPKPVQPSNPATPKSGSDSEDDEDDDEE